MGQHQIQLNEVERFSPTMPFVNEKRYGDIAKQSRKGIALQWKRNFAYLVRSQPQNCDSLKTISELKPKAVNSASLSEIVFGYI